jgi:holo-[acyl-carrier protein] synthase
VTLGVDLVDIGRLRSSLSASPRLEERLFTKEERLYCAGKPDPIMHLAGTLAAKEAVIKALRLGRLVEWSGRIEISRRASGEPEVSVDGDRVPLEISISHERRMAVAVALATS